MSGLLIKDTTRAEREKIIRSSLDYIDGKKEIAEINAEYNARFLRG